MNWLPHSWRSFPASQQPEYENEEHLSKTLESLRKLPPLVHFEEIESLKQAVAKAGNGEAFMLQGGDCAELFSYCNNVDIENKLKVLIQMSLVLIWGGKTPLVRIWRGAGQYAKPRTNLTETVKGQEVPVFRGDSVNGHDITERKPNPDRLLSAYFYSSATWNYVRSLLSGGFADLHRSSQWSLSHIQSSPVQKEYESIIEKMKESLDFVQTIQAENQHSTRSVDLFNSHEGLLLPYEESMTRNFNNKWYNLGAHFLWIGDRTRQLDGAHLEYFRGIANPIGVKVGPTTIPQELVELVKILNPHQEAGKITLIVRLGIAYVRELLPQLIRVIQDAQLNVVWMCDPMHGNTEITVDGMKTRRFDNIQQELILQFQIHEELNSRLGGVHFEMTGDAVTGEKNSDE